MIKSVNPIPVAVGPIHQLSGRAVSRKLLVLAIGGVVSFINGHVLIMRGNGGGGVIGFFSAVLVSTCAMI